MDTSVSSGDALMSSYDDVLVLDKLTHKPNL